MQSRRHPISRNGDAPSPWIYVLFLLSGTAGLVYQVVWSRLLHEVFGVTVHAVAVVLATFLGGLALGGAFWGRLADRVARPLRLYGWLEVGVGLTGLAGTWIVRLLDPLHAAAAGRFAVDSAALFFVRLLLAAAVVLPPTFLMGGTLPVIVRVFVDRMQRVGREIGLLYALNACGAVAGAVLAGFVLIRFFGLHATLWTAVAANLAIGSAALLYARRSPTRAGDARPGDVPPARRGTAAAGGPGILVVMGLSGFASLGLEVVWTRVLMLSLGTTIYAFVTMLASFLTGLTLGSYLARGFADRVADPRRTMGWVQLGIAASTLATLPVLAAPFMQRWLEGRGSAWLLLIVMRFGVSLLIMLVPTTLIGMTFPLAAKIWTRRVRSLGARLGEIYAVNTLGNVLGATVTGFVLVAALGLQKSVVVLVTLNLANAAWGFLSAARAGRWRAAPVGVGILACAVLVSVWQPRPFAAWSEGEADRTLYYKEGLVATVKVLEREYDPDQRWIAVDGIKIGQTRGGVDVKQQILAHMPFLLMPE
jgi:spermidine synthase